MARVTTPQAVERREVQPVAPIAPARAWRTVALSWLTARLVVLSAFTLARYLHRTTHLSKHFEGVLGWDADWYRRIAVHGYAALPHEALRFFPLLPLLAHLGGQLPGVTVGVALLVLSNVGAVVYAHLMHRLAVREGLPPAAAQRVVWVVALTPAAFVLVMGYAEPLSGAVAVGIALLVRARRWWPVVPLGLCAGALRPTGCVIGLFIAVEAARSVRGTGGRELVARACAVLAPIGGLLSYLAWVGARFGDPIAPFTVQTTLRLRGGTLVSPVAAADTAVRGLASGQIPTQAPHLAWVVITIVLAIVCARRLPVSYLVFAVAIIVLGATARDFQSFERYAAGAFPLLVAVASLRASSAWATAAAVTSGALLAGYTLLAALHLYVP
ncbi:MAG: hypothetical protein NVSMB55_09630 [Mycobacteriales bacterium]